MWASPARQNSTPGGGIPKNLTKDQLETIDAVLGFYGDKSAQWLSDLSHAEAPWKSARTGIPDGIRGEIVIPKQNLAEYYGSL